MASTSVLRAVGPTIGLSVGNTSHASVLVAPGSNDVLNYMACLNTGAVAVAIHLDQNTGVAAVLPGDGTLGDFVLPPAMEQPIVLACPNGQAYVTAIGAAAGPSMVYVTPVGDQS